MVILFLRFFSFLEHYGHKSRQLCTFQKECLVSQFWTFLKMSIFHFGHDFWIFFVNLI
jgi:hypothetical protein